MTNIHIHITTELYVPCVHPTRKITRTKGVRKNFIELMFNALTNCKHKNVKNIYFFLLMPGSHWTRQLT